MNNSIIDDFDIVASFQETMRGECEKSERFFEGFEKTKSEYIFQNVEEKNVFRLNHLLELYQFLIDVHDLDDEEIESLTEEQEEEYMKDYFYSMFEGELFYEEKMPGNNIEVNEIYRGYYYSVFEITFS